MSRLIESTSCFDLQFFARGSGRQEIIRGQSTISDILQESSSSTARSLLAVGIALCVSGCAAFRSYDAELYGTLDQAASGNVDGAIRLLESANPGKDLLYYLELGMLQRLGDRYPDSQKAWMAANAAIQASRRRRASRAVEAGRRRRELRRQRQGAPLRGARLREGHAAHVHRAQLSRAWATTSNARVAIKQTHELEAVIAELRAKQLRGGRGGCEEAGARTSFKELNGYPVQSIDNPAVNALRNSYQSALSHYLAGFVYESLGEPSLAAPGYRLANELQPNQPLLEEALRGLDQRVAAPDDGMTDVLFVIGTGTAPALQSRQFSLPVLVRAQLVLFRSPSR